jgi:DNA-binding winged helix-turn-helix (wHTH) protein
MTYCFGDYELDEARFELRRTGQKVRVEPKVLDLIVLLVRARDRVVLKREVLDALWADVTVSEASVWRVILEARRALGDESQETIVTMRGRGFRFAAPVVEKDAGGAAPVAPPLARDPLLVGREAAFAAVSARLSDAIAGRGSLVWLSGEAGIGKTRVAEEVARQAELRGATVLTAHGHESVETPPFWLWTEILRAQSDEGGEAAPRLSGRVAALLEGATVPPAEHFALFDAIARHFTEAARERPVVFVLDDLHWADEPSLRLLEFLGRDVRQRAWLVVGTYRDAGLRPDARGRALGGLIGMSGALSVPVRGFSVDEVTRLVESRTGVRPSTTLAAALRERSGGNPLYVEQLLRTAWAESALQATAQELASTIDLQHGIIETIGRHLDAMSDAGREFLTVAAVLGKEFRLAELAVVTGLAPDALLDRIDEAVRASILFQDKDGKYGFLHVLVRDVLTKRMSAAARAALHRSVGEKLLAHYGEAVDPHVVDLADHFLRALPGGDPERAVDLGTRAAERQSGLGRHKEAAKLWQRTAAAYALLPKADARRVGVQLALARALLASGQRAEACGAFLDAAVLAQTFAQPEAMAEAALEYAALAGEGQTSRRALLELSLSALGGAGPDGGDARGLRTRVEAALSREPP